MARRTVLIVEDTPDFMDFYSRHVERAEAIPYVVSSLNAALELIAQLSFAAAFVDIRLSEADDHNLDGLRVLEALTKSRDGTKAVVVTGHGSFEIARDAILRYGAFDAVNKAELTPTLFQQKLEKALVAYNQDFSRIPLNPTYILKPAEIPVWKWEHEVLTVCTPIEGARGLYMFLERFVRELAPLIPLKPDVALTVNRQRGFCEGIFWSRGIGKAAFVRIGHTDAMEGELGSGTDNQPVMEAYIGGEAVVGVDVGEVLFRESTYGITGVAFEVRGLEASSFGLRPDEFSPGEEL